jgi:formyltetrahydrofolate hydrolase
MREHNMSEIIYEDRMGDLENDLVMRIANYVVSRYGMEFHAVMYTPEGRRAAAAVFWADYFETNQEI